MNKSNLRSGLLVEMASGAIAMVIFAKALGYFLLEESGTTSPLSDWDDDLKCPADPDCDIMAIYEPTDINDLAQDEWPDIISDLTAIWVREPEVPAEPEVTQPNPADLNRTAEFRVKTWIEINGKEVDVNNLTPNEAKLLVSLGLMPPEILNGPLGRDEAPFPGIDDDYGLEDEEDREVYEYYY